IAHTNSAITSKCSIWSDALHEDTQLLQPEFCTDAHAQLCLLQCLTALLDHKVEYIHSLQSPFEFVLCSTRHRINVLVR
ncbi:hypothetical protein PMAYCL1PPCAC_32408, partial [Pristionchus mayeri]